jgi:hypothetical protein
MARTRLYHEYNVEGNVASFIINRTRYGIKSTHIILIDNEDIPIIYPYRWHIVENSEKEESGYTPHPHVVSSTLRHCKDKNHPYAGKMILLSRLVTNCPRHLVVDHINHNFADNRKENLRCVTTSQNTMNSRKKMRGKLGSKYKGVYKEKRCKNIWVAQIGFNKKRMKLGYFKDERLAAIAYDEAAKQYHGEFACLNFPERNQSEERELCTPSCSQ